MAQNTLIVKNGLGTTDELMAVELGTGEKATLQIPFETAVNMGMVEGFSVIDKFGFNSAITTTTDPEDVWEGGGVYTYDAFGTAPIVSLASSSGADTQDISILGLDITGALVSQTITLAGTARQALTTPLWRVFRMQNESSVSISGTVFCYTGTGTVPSVGDSEVRAVIDNGNNQTQMALYTVPLGYVGFLYYGEIAMEQAGTAFSGNEYANCAYKSRRKEEVFKVKKTVPLNSQGSSVYQEDRRFPDIIPELTDIKLTVNEVSATMGISGAFDILLVEEGRLPATLLTAIGQG